MAMAGPGSPLGQAVRQRHPNSPREYSPEDEVGAAIPGRVQRFHGEEVLRTASFLKERSIATGRRIP